MNYYQVAFWLCLGIITYTYLGYGFILYLMVRIKRLFIKKVEPQIPDDELPEVTILIPAYNEKEYIRQKMKNTDELNYPSEKLNVYWITDGSTDDSNLFLENYKNVRVFHEPERKGKINAINRIMPFVQTSISIFCDANTDLSRDAIIHIVHSFADEKVGCVSGEKRIQGNDEDHAAGAGEGIYWKYESLLKKWDAELYSVVGAAGELFAIRTELFEPVEADTLLDDFMISLRIAMRGKTIQYNPEAYAVEKSSKNVTEELKRKVRIAAGGIQSIIRLRGLFNFFKYGLLSFQFISHRVLRWTLAPLSLILLIPLNLLLFVSELESEFGIYSLFMILQVFSYLTVLFGRIFEHRSIRLKVLFVPYYFFIMNFSVVLGFIRYMRNNQTVNWERAERAQ